MWNISEWEKIIPHNSLTDLADISYIYELHFWWIVLRDRNEWKEENNWNKKRENLIKILAVTFEVVKISSLTFQINELLLLSRALLIMIFKWNSAKTISMSRNSSFSSPRRWLERLWIISCSHLHLCFFIVIVFSFI